MLRLSKRKGKKKNRLIVLEVHGEGESDLTNYPASLTQFNTFEIYICTYAANNQFNCCDMKLIVSILGTHTKWVLVFFYCMRSACSWGEGRGQSHYPTVTQFPCIYSSLVPLNSFICTQQSIAVTWKLFLPTLDTYPFPRKHTKWVLALFYCVPFLHRGLLCHPIWWIAEAIPANDSNAHQTNTFAFL